MGTAALTFGYFRIHKYTRDVDVAYRRQVIPAEPERADSRTRRSPDHRAEFWGRRRV